jgi:hypothetical protein
VENGPKIAFQYARRNVEMMGYDPRHHYKDFGCGKMQVETARRVEKERKANVRWVGPPRKERKCCRS